jgi:hypothetical protein
MNRKMNSKEVLELLLLHINYTAQHDPPNLFIEHHEFDKRSASGINNDSIWGVRD